MLAARYAAARCKRSAMARHSGSRHGFHNDEFRAGLIAQMQFGINRARERFGIMGNHTHAPDFDAGRNVSMCDDEDALAAMRPDCSDNNRASCDSKSCSSRHDENHQPRFRRVMLSQLSRAAQAFRRCVEPLAAKMHPSRPAAIPRESFPAAASAAACRDVEHGGFDADLRLSAVDNQRNQFAQTACDVLGIRRRNFVRTIRARRCQWETARANHRLHERMAGPANAHGVSTGGDDIGNFCGARQHERQRARPKSSREFVCQFRPLRAQRRAIARSETWTMIGLCAGRPLASKMRCTAVASSAFAASP